MKNPNWKAPDFENGSFIEWVEYSPNSYANSIGRKMAIAKKRPTQVSIDDIYEYQDLRAKSLNEKKKDLKFIDFFKSKYPNTPIDFI